MSTAGERWHRVLLRQLHRAGMDPDEAVADGRLAMLLDRVSLAYREADQERYLNDRAFRISSKEMQDLYDELSRVSASELAAERDRLQAVFDSVATGLIVLGPDGRVTALNPAAELLLGRSSEGAAGQALHEVIQGAPQDEPAADGLAALAAALVAGQPWRGGDLILVTPAGREFPGNAVFAPMGPPEARAGGVLAITDVTERKRAEAELAWRATHDALTGLLNRTALHERVRDVLADRRARESGCAVLFVDLDRFKLVNDTLGHAVGDRVLVTAAERIRAAIRRQDSLARLGGDEFVVLGEQVCDDSEALGLAGRIVHSLGDPYDVGGDVAYLSASVGVAVPRGDDTPTSLLRDADVALYRAKGLGRGRAVLFDPAMQDEVADRVRLERHLRHALDAEGLALAFQPIIDVRRGGLVGFETLVRWEGPDGHVDPSVFVRLAEDSGLVGMMGDWVLEAGAAFLRSLDRHAQPGLSLAVNLSAIQLGDPDLPPRIADLVQRCGAPDGRLLLEITETALLQNPDLAELRLGQLRDAGVRIALDDFGTGYSSLSSLRRFPLDALKIDRSFVSGMCTSAHDRAIVAAVVSLGHALGMEVIAEGIEHPEQLDVIRALDCDLAQGFLLGEPMAPAAAQRRAREQGHRPAAGSRGAQ